MQRSELEPAIRAATEIVQQDEVMVIGSQSVLGTWTEDELPAEAIQSEEVDIAPLHDDDAQSLATLLDGVAGELSAFHQTHGFYMQGVGRDTAVLPDGWEERLVRVSNDNTNGRTGVSDETPNIGVEAAIVTSMRHPLNVTGRRRAK